jgi:hypothetical protein
VTQLPGGRTIDDRGAHATARIGTFFTGYVRERCPGRGAATLIARAAEGFVAWAQVH